MKGEGVAFIERSEGTMRGDHRSPLFFMLILIGMLWVCGSIKVFSRMFLAAVGFWLTDILLGGPGDEG